MSIEEEEREKGQEWGDTPRVLPNGYRQKILWTKMGTKKKNERENSKCEVAMRIKNNDDETSCGGGRGRSTRRD